MTKPETAPDMIDYFAPQNRHPLYRWMSASGRRMRRRMYDHFIRCLQPDAAARVVDIGVTPNPSPDANYLEQYYPHKQNLTATSIEDAGFLTAMYPGMKFVRTTAEALPFADKTFDIAFCSAVIEHVGDRAAQRRFIQECVRVARRFYITTPNRWFPLDVHTVLPLFHWLPQRAHQAVLRGLNQRFYAQTSNLNLLGPRDFRALFPPCRRLQLDYFHLFGWPQNLVIWGEG